MGRPSLSQLHTYNLLGLGLNVQATGRAQHDEPHQAPGYVGHGSIVTPGFQGHQDPGANIITRCARTKSHTYDESWHMIECHIFTI
jgi:hypothetical protein